MNRSIGGRRDDDLLRHDENKYAHGPALADIAIRMTSYEKWQQRVIGAVSALSLVVGILVAAHWIP